jgi:hypothetical protein
VEVQTGEVYDFKCDPSQRWKDWLIPTGPNGFFNPLATLVGLRVKKVKCFALCTAYIHDENKNFTIGSERKITATDTGQLFFFANDSPKHYGNNKGSLQLRIERTV